METRKEERKKDLYSRFKKDLIVWKRVFLFFITIAVSW